MSITNDKAIISVFYDNEHGYYCFFNDRDIVTRRGYIGGFSISITNQ